VAARSVDWAGSLKGFGRLQLECTGSVLAPVVCWHQLWKGATTERCSRSGWGLAQLADDSPDCQPVKLSKVYNITLWTIQKPSR
jgi:hypothetical protein